MYLHIYLFFSDTMTDFHHPVSERDSVTANWADGAVPTHVRRKHSSSEQSSIQMAILLLKAEYPCSSLQHGEWAASMFGVTSQLSTQICISVGDWWVHSASHKLWFTSFWVFVFFFPSIFNISSLSFEFFQQLPVPLCLTTLLDWIH